MSFGETVFRRTPSPPFVRPTLLNSFDIHLKRPSRSYHWSYFATPLEARCGKDRGAGAQQPPDGLIVLEVYRRSGLVRVRISKPGVPARSWKRH